MQTICARCKEAITCTADDIARCACTAVSLRPSELQYIKSRKYPGCLCAACLAAMQTEFSALPEYFIEKGNYVFSAKGLINRGYCCGSGCRNCPYR
ncbi:MAG: cysteine-rich CWC family protein [Chitinophagales bacterium]